MLNFLNAGQPAQPPLPGALGTPFQWLPAGLAFGHRRWRLLLGTAALGLGAGLAYLAIATPQYTAIATITIDARRANPVGGQQASGDWQSESAYIESQVELIRSPATLRGVVELLALEREPRFAAPSPGALGQLANSVKTLLPGLGSDSAGLTPEARARALAATAVGRALEVWRVGATSVVEIRVRTPERVLSARLANAVTAAYMEQQLVAVSETTRRAGSWLETRIGELRGQAVAADRAVQTYKAGNNIVDVGIGAASGQMNEQQLGELNVQVANARSRLAEAQARYERARASTVGGVTQGVVSEAAQNGVMVRLRQQYLEALRREAELTARHGPGHGAVILQHNEALELQRSMQNELARLTETYRGDYEVALANLRGIQSRLAEQVAAAAQTNIERSELRSLQSSATAYRNIYENFLQRFTQAMQDQSYPISDARVAAMALPPLERSNPRAALTLALGMMLGLGAGLALAMAREALDCTVRSLAQLRLATGLETLGAITRQASLSFRLAGKPGREGIGRRLMAVPAAFGQAAAWQDSAMADAVHAIRAAAARQSARGCEVRVIGCVSAQAGEGTSTVAANLAFALAAEGLRTTLVDWNAASPWLTEVLSPTPRAGLQELANRDISLDGVAVTDGRSGLRFIGQTPGGAALPPMTPANARTLLTELRERNDYVVLDLPPMLDSNTVARLSDVIDGLVLVVRWGGTPQPLLAEALARAAAADALFLGAVLNQCDPDHRRLYPAAQAHQQPSRALPSFAPVAAG